MQIEPFAVQLQTWRRPEREERQSQERGRRGGDPDDEEAPAEALGAEGQDPRQPFVMPPWQATAARPADDDRQSFSDALRAQETDADANKPVAADPPIAHAPAASYSPDRAADFTPLRAVVTPPPRAGANAYRRNPTDSTTPSGLTIRI